MEEFIRNNFGYILGIIFTPITYYIVKTIKCTFKSTKHKKYAKKDSNNRYYSQITNKGSESM